MNLKIPLRVGRILVVLALIVALLGSSIPVPARAVGAGVLYNIAANTGVNLALRAIGVGPGNSPAVFNNLVTTIGEAVSSATAPLAQLLITGSSGNFRSFLSTDFLSWILSWLFDSGTLEPGTFVGRSSFDFTFNGSKHYDILAPNQVSSSVAQFFVASAYVTDRSRTYYLLVASAPHEFVAKTGEMKYASSVPSGGLNYICTPEYALAAPTTSLSVIEFGDLTYNDFMVAISQYSLTSVSTSSDLTLDSVGDSLDASPYTDWVDQSVSDNDQAFVPVSVPSLDSSAISAQTQSQAQSGTIPDAVVDEIIAGEDVVPDTGTIADVITSIRALGADIVAAIQAVPAAIADVFSPPAISDEYMISLSDFFPFCLPFDIYDLLSALAADPQAPVFEWTIAVPRWGISHDIEIDLSEWDDIARLFRTFELGAFVLGLALITRQKFLRS